MSGRLRTGSIELPVFPLLSLMQKENMGEPHAVFAGGERYVSPRFSAEAERVVRRELENSGLGGTADFDAFLELVDIVQRATLEYYGWVTTTDESYCVLVATFGRAAVLVVRSGQRVRFERCEPDRLAETLVWRLPDVGVAHGEPFSVRHTDFHAPRGRAEGSVMRRSVAARPEGARRLDTLLKSRRVAVAKLYAAKRDVNGVRQRSDRWLTVLDLVDGRWALSVSQVRGEQWINAAPGTHQHVADKLFESAR